MERSVRCCGVERESLERHSLPDFPWERAVEATHGDAQLFDGRSTSARRVTRATDLVTVDPTHRIPPTRRIAPDNQPDSSLMRHATTGETFSGSLGSHPSPTGSGAIPALCVIGVLAIGEIALAVTPYRSISSATTFVMPMIADFADE